ncbi:MULTISPECIES: LysR family transcriptional regulator [unclassified Rhizobium]|uniref:LysR family transcriptional regulator n=1 Tax=unclassified Rhizobium TaxID=2613769 RepID=UPI001ADB917C|nr:MULTISPECIES: LysR family transcriptional regulator [unclassified Rhizobium]MBO9100993.1 LysR family transcriptional regulator [Rhizobium sp. L58/93]MBO9171671.1 LysR family transcriptional regulator [Rhizobium sp. L245/93]MBO9186583.1 LysR family transcriptional regulator [Rhizobium sp. E27B/91]QXZ86040.1 LysR family transcriptional regulator [Rhizobium sp. K1/93]QXZ92502.1 LysR family transcriptional regulator [Rhizobium sp. K15/93]
MTRITLAQIEAFVWTVELGSAQKAADHLHLAQPSISLRLKDLRDAVGSELLQRTGKGMVLTAEGRAFLPRAHVIMTEVGSMQNSDASNGVAGTIRVGLAEGFAVNCLAPLLAGLLEDHPKLSPEWVVSTSTTLETALVDDGLDVAILLNPIGHEKVTLKPLGPQPTSWVAPAAWKIDRAVSPKDLWDKPIICNPSPSAMHRQMSYWFANANIQPVNVSSCTSVAVIAELVASGLGAAILPTRMAARHLSEETMQLLPSNPGIENGRLFVGFRKGTIDPKGIAVETTTARILDKIGYHLA